VAESLSLARANADRIYKLLILTIATRTGARNLAFASEAQSCDKDTKKKKRELRVTSPLAQGFNSHPQLLDDAKFAEIIIHGLLEFLE
jgi:hypothetical protein